jgi:hypothetical protein
MKAKKKAYKKGGVLPKAIKKLKEKAAKKKAEKSKPSYRGVTDEVTVTAKAPTKSEKAGAKAFIESNSVSRLASYSEASGGKDGSNLQEDTAKRLNVPNTPSSIYTSNKRKKNWNKALKKSGYRN